MKRKAQIRALEARIDALVRENEARVKAATRAACKHPNAIYTRAVIGSPDSFAGVMDTYNWKCEDCGTARGGNTLRSADDWPDWARVRVGLAARHVEGGLR